MNFLINNYAKRLREILVVFVMRQFKIDLNFYFKVSFAVIPERQIRAITFGTAISALNISAMFHTADTVR